APAERRRLMTMEDDAPLVLARVLTPVGSQCRPQPRSHSCSVGCAIPLSFAVRKLTGDLGGTMHTSIETYRGVVYPWVIDHVGHMNVQFYTARFDEATWHFLARLGLTPSYMTAHERAAVAADARTQYKREVRSGTLLHVSTQLLAVGRTSVRFIHRMYDSETDEEIATTEL